LHNLAIICCLADRLLLCRQKQWEGNTSGILSLLSFCSGRLQTSTVVSTAISGGLKPSSTIAIIATNSDCTGRKILLIKLAGQAIIHYKSFVRDENALKRTTQLCNCRAFLID